MHAFLGLLSFCLLLLSGADGPPKSPGAAQKDLSAASAATDPAAFLSALKAVLQADDARAVHAAALAYSKFSTGALKRMEPREFMAFHGSCASAFAAVKSKPAADELRKLLASHPDWTGRLLLLDAAGIAKPVNRLESALVALRDEHPAVARRALQYLVRARQVRVVDAIVQRYLEVSKKKPKEGEAAQWDRTRLAFQSTLQRLLGVDLPAPEDYKNYFETRKSDPKIFDPPRESKDSVSRVTLFGAAVTGKNIVFVLDVSGSMMTTDPLPPGEWAPRRDAGRTVVGDPARQPTGEDAVQKLAPQEDRQRMFRAKKELSNVVRNLPSDVRFNLVTYSSEVHTWRKGMVPASDANKKDAARYVDGLKADGITVTDLALEEAFSDPTVDTIYLVTDGAPTHVGNSVPGQLPDDSPHLIREIHERVGELNFLRGVRIFTLGFKEANEEFLQKLAGENAGTYVAIQ